MAASDDSSNSSSYVTDSDQNHEYYEELDTHTLDFRKRKAPTPIPIPVKSFVKETPPVLDPIQKLNEQLNRQFRPDLVPPTLSPPTASEPIIKRIPSPDPVIFDARAKPIKSSKKKKKSSIDIKQKLFNPTHQLTEPITKSVLPSKSNMSYQQTTNDGFYVPPGMMLVPAPQQQQQSFPRVIEPSQQYPTVSQNNPSTLNYNNSLKNNKVAPPPFVHNRQQVFQSPSSGVSTNHLIQSSGAFKQQQQQQQNLFKHIDQPKSNKKKHKKQSIDNITDKKNSNRSFALYNQQNGRIEGVVKNRLNVATDDGEENGIDDEESEPEEKWIVWLYQPLCLGLTRLSGGILFGSMILLGCAAFAGLIVSSVLYSQDDVTNAQWKILGIVVCTILLITIVVTLLIFLCCYKHGYVFDDDYDNDPTDRSITQDAEGNERQKAVLRKIYKFNRPNESSSIPSEVPTHVPTPPPPPKPQPSVHVNDKQTNTETTIALLRPKDLDRGVWPSINAYGGISYRPLDPPQMTSHSIQVLPHEIEQTLNPPQPVYQVVAPTAAIQPQQSQPQIIQIPAQQAPVIEYIEPTPKQQPRTIQIPAQQEPVVEYFETTQKQQPRTKIIRQPQTQQIVMQPTNRIEYVDMEDQRGRRIVQQPQYVDVEDQRGRRVVQQPQYVDVEDQRGRRVVQQPQYEIVEELTDRSILSSPGQEIVEIVDEPKHDRHHRRKKDKKRGFRKISVKNLRS